ncbi:UDP-N-acetylmuramoyl-tripeptide--D-alanyl-D-alanine ligase [Flavobacterium sp. WW92]|uniref:UDP-N-acetylmuramoyl-tripeptide--D-alanyl-D- alanine ligase n=1 Tax=unclassified Flavobacterium TaxID=196869 RepID=UPI00222457E3|nr:MULTISPECIES: UDP-N-acetylmuramoyl-tripeptide--D-alanyl-D-alanine ligase [unclassified Flavobacterium]WDO14306.1 UDP-N-acetylmuramoyl-tripeptide--D-alanyl-D-alanine ligase [Flavobacterium sp. WW92]
MEIKDIHDLFLRCASVSIDTRKIEDNCMFFAIKGERFDANTFAAEALEKGASFVIIDNKQYFIDDRTILVNNTLETLQEVAKFHRDYLGLPIIGLTGSNGKTTTKELINVVLSKRYTTKATIGNLNNHIGVPLTLLSFNSDTEIGIVEMGANHQKEIEFLCSIARPDFGYITNFGKAHLEGFGGVEGVIKGKSEMYQFLSDNNKYVFVNLDDTIQREKTEKNLRITFSHSDKNASVLINKITANPFVAVEFDGIKVKSHLIGLYNANNINAAITIGRYFKISDDEIKEAIESYIPENNRSQMLVKNSNEIILDAYNANPSSMEVAIKNFLQLDKPNKVAILGDMFELGKESLHEHKHIVALLKNEKEVAAYFIGKDFYSNKLDKKNLFFFETFDEFSEAFREEKMENKTMLIKGSRGMALERTLELL